MNPPRWNDFFAQFFNSRAPLFFIIGSILLGVIGNGVYSLLTLWVGASPFRIFAITVGAAFILPFVWYSLRAAIAAFRLQRQPGVPIEQPIDPQQGLIVLVGLGQGDLEEQVMAHHIRQPPALRYCWLIASDAVRAQQKHTRLQHWLGERNVLCDTLAIGDANQAQMTYDAVRSALAEATRRFGSAVVVDITGGTKPMTAGAVLACRDADAAMQYMVSTRDEHGQPRGPSAAMQVEFGAAQQEQQ